MGCRRAPLVRPARRGHIEVQQVVGAEPIPFCAETVRRLVAEGKRVREIAEHFGVTPAAVYQWRYRGRF